MLIALALGPAIGLSAAAKEPVALAGRAMGTSWSVTFVPPPVPLAAKAVEERVASRLEELENVFSTYRNDSELTRFNARRDTDWVPVTPELAQVAAASRGVSELTGGAFDVTVFPLIQLWGFGPARRAGKVPGAAEIAAAGELVDWRQLEVRQSPPALRKTRPRLSADFSSMAKGFAADAVSELLTALGVPDHLVQIGGDLKAGGRGADGAGWRAAIEQPREDERAIACVLTLRGRALSTSGDYRNFFPAGGQRFGHILDPRSGRPSSSPLGSVSVVHDSCAQSSAWATALFVLGPEEGRRVATAQGLACLFLVRKDQGVIRISSPAFDQLQARDGSGASRMRE